MSNQIQAQEEKHQLITYKVISNKEWPITGSLAGSSKPGGKDYTEESIMSDFTFIYQQGMRVIYNLTKNPSYNELSRRLWQSKFKDTVYVTNVTGVDIAIEDYHAPTQRQLNIITDDIITRLNRGENILVHCAAGKGRAGTILTAVYMKLFKIYIPEDAIKYVRKHYNAGAVETESQVEALRIFAQNLEFKTIYNLDEVFKIAQTLPKGSVIFIDIDDTIITPKSSSFRTKESEINLIDEIKNNKHLYSNYSEILSNWRLSRKILLVDNSWPAVINSLKNKYQVYALTKMDIGEFGNIKSMKQWRYDELSKLNIEFSSLNNEHAYHGILMTGPLLKSQIIEKYLKQLKPTHIMFIDDRSESLIDVGNFCRQHKIDFTGILYRGVDKLSGAVDPKIRAIQFDYLINKAKWLEDEEVFLSGHRK